MKLVFYCEEAAPANGLNQLALGVSGTVGALLLACRGLAARGHEVHVLNRSPTGTFAGVHHHETRSADEMRAHVAWLGPADAFVANGYAVSAVLDARVPARKVVYWSHNYVDQRPAERAFRAGTLDHVVCVSENQLGTWWRSPHFTRVCRIYNAVDFEVFDRFKTHAPPARRVMFVGAPRACKGFDDAVRVFLEFRREHPAFEFAVAGSASLHGVSTETPGAIFEPDYEAQVLAKLLYDETGALKPGLTLLGNLPKARLWEFLAASQALLANPSWTSQPETFGLSALEAQALGVPVVSTRRGGMPEVIAHRRGGFLVGRRGVAPLVDALKQTVGDTPMRTRLQTTEGARLRRRFGVERIAADWENRLVRMGAGGRFYESYALAARRKLLRRLRLG